MPTWSIIIPALNEAARIGQHIGALRRLNPEAEIIVVDGGSDDQTVALAREAGARVVMSERGRGPQCNAGAMQAHGAVLIFLHADTELPADAFALLEARFSDPHVQIAKFRLSFASDDPILALAARMMWWDSLLTSYGDQGIVIRRTFFDDLGGFPDWPLFEDVRLFELARARTSVHVIPTQVITSARRFNANGTIPQLLHDLWLWLQYLIGVPPSELAHRYEQGPVFG
ncbi:glycosyl transferase family 2 [Oscillochloris trichoides DG-6]|uniref:4,4'-diaponeurosporenoate glycosyltransferase n=1 Tax=Oscillochloris trichoides DG-6 TaxID=765420 RepID=E1IE48_9CHLR|nr:TIGR04283 family arsenosugar biosynthesis glycosyltransferase [Oscillochloris trichoides]EFO80508.1 glycosyl transferase family 2 [Oscillochloris trichoides DG-6]